MQLHGLFGSFAPWLLLAFFGQHVTLSFGRRGSPGSSRVDKYSGSGKFTIKEKKMQCTWSSRYSVESVVVRVTCENPEARVKGGVTDLQCDYRGMPDKCPGFLSNPRDFWRQVGRSFRKLKAKACVDQRALVRTGMCRRAPKEAHFKLDYHSSVSGAQSGEQEPPPPINPPTSTSTANSTLCASKHLRTAEEYCSSQWTSVCSFLLSILQSEDC